MKAFKDFNESKLSITHTTKIVGGTGGNASEDVPITSLGTIKNEGD